MTYSAAKYLVIVKVNPNFYMLDLMKSSFQAILCLPNFHKLFMADHYNKLQNEYMFKCHVFKKKKNPM